MKKAKYVLAVVLLFSIMFSFTPTVIPQIGVYEFHGAAGNVKILKVRTVDNASLNALFGENWTEVIGIFGGQAYDVGAQSKSLVKAVNTTAKYLGYDVTNYTTDNWAFTTGDFSSTPDFTNYTVTSFYDPANLTALVNFITAITSPYILQNVSLHNIAAVWLAQLPTPVNSYLQAISWQSQWGSVGNTIVYHAKVGDLVYSPYTEKLYSYLENSTEIWTYDTTYGSWIGYKILDNESNTIYEFSVELPTIPAIPSYDLTIFLGITAITTVGIMYILVKKRRKL